MISGVGSAAWRAHFFSFFGIARSLRPWRAKAALLELLTPATGASKLASRETAF